MNTLRLYQAMLNASLKPTAMRVMVAILSKILSYCKTSDNIAFSQLESLTGLRSDKIKAGLQDLEKAGLIIIKQGKYGRIITLNPALIQTTPQKTKPAQSFDSSPCIEYPAQLSLNERKQARSKLDGLPPEGVQTILSILKAKLDTTDIKSPIAYLSGLIKRYRAGNLTASTIAPIFKPKIGIKKKGADDTPAARRAHDLMLAKLLNETSSVGEYGV